MPPFGIVPRSRAFPPTRARAPTIAPGSTTTPLSRTVSSPISPPTDSPPGPSPPPPPDRDGALDVAPAPEDRAVPDRHLPADRDPGLDRPRLHGVDGLQDLRVQPEEVPRVQGVLPHPLRADRPHGLRGGQRLDRAREVVLPLPRERLNRGEDGLVERVRARVDQVPDRLPGLLDDLRDAVLGEKDDAVLRGVLALRDQDGRAVAALDQVRDRVVVEQVRPVQDEELPLDLRAGLGERVARAEVA